MSGRGGKLPMAGIVKKVFYLLLAVAAAGEVLVVNVLHWGHGHFWFEELPAFGSLLGLGASVLIIVIAKILLQPVVGKKEDYYD